MSHAMMHPLFVMPAGSSGDATAALSFTLVDSSNVPLAGYNPTQATLNFSVDPEYVDYEGAPKNWRTFSLVPQPSVTILAIMAYGSADHVMAQYFTGEATDYPAPRKERDHGCVVWVDGHATLEKRGSVFAAAHGIDRFHPERAR